MSKYKVMLVPHPDCDVKGLMRLLKREINREENLDRKSVKKIKGRSVSKILDDEYLQRDLQYEGVHIGYTFPITVSKIDIKDFEEDKRDSLKVITFIDVEG